jgi:hypothetical protein
MSKNIMNMNEIIGTSYFYLRQVFGDRVKPNNYDVFYPKVADKNKEVEEESSASEKINTLQLIGKNILVQDGMPIASMMFSELPTEWNKLQAPIDMFASLQEIGDLPKQIQTPDKNEKKMTEAEDTEEEMDDSEEEEQPPIIETRAPVIETPASVIETPAPVIETPAPIIERPAPVVPKVNIPLQRPSPIKPGNFLDELKSRVTNRTTSSNEVIEAGLKGKPQTNAPPAKLDLMAELKQKLAKREEEKRDTVTGIATIA